MKYRAAESSLVDSFKRKGVKGYKKIVPSTITTCINLENIGETKSISFKAQSKGTPSQLFMQHIFIWDKK
jgi:hypothetical protein